MSFRLTILGCHSAIPSINRNPTAQILHSGENVFLIDCGEGTQIQLIKHKIKTQSINHILISHLHGDHYFGLIGLITTMHLQKRTKELHLYAHQELKSIIDLQLIASHTELQFPLFFHPIPTDQEKSLFEDDGIIIRNILLEHSIPTSGFLFKEKQKKHNIKKEKIDEYQIPISEIEKIKEGADFVTANGDLILNKELTTLNHTLYSYAFCSDTEFVKKNLSKLRGITLLYHEATFMNNLTELAKKTKHSTTIDAATFAKLAKVKHLLIGHYSSRYQILEDLHNEASAVFPNTILAIDGLSIHFDLL